MKIAIGIPTLNRYDLLKENLADLKQNFPHDGLIIVDNGNQGIPPEPFISAIYHPGKNLGVAASWNYILSTAFSPGYDADYCVILNDDIVLGKTREYIEKVINSNSSDFIVGTYFWSVFIVSKNCFETVGNFDEKFYPAYFEDNDYYYRMMNSDIVYQEAPEINPSVKRNSMTIKKDSKINKKFMDNHNYFVKKWGGKPGHETFKTPFNR